MNRNDILYRTQYSAQAMAGLADKIATDIKNGSICISDVKNFTTLDMILGTLICNVPRKETLAVGQIEISNALAGALIATIKVNGVSINNNTILYGGSLPIYLDDIVDNINTAFTIPNYSAEVVPNTNFINIIADAGSGDSPNGFLITISSNVTTINIISSMAGGVDGQDIGLMCLDKDKLDGLFEYFSKKTGICFNPFDTPYNTPDGPTTATASIATNTGFTLITGVGYIMGSKG